MANLPQVKTAGIPMFGGLDLTTPHDRIKPGFVFEAKNFQSIVTGGYETIRGYERTCGNAVLSSNDWFSIGLSDVSTVQLGDKVKAVSQVIDVVFLTDDDGVLLMDDDGVFLVEYPSNATGPAEIGQGRVVAIDGTNKQVCVVSLSGTFPVGSTIVLER